jgi:hypothetical protein
LTGFVENVVRSPGAERMEVWLRSLSADSLDLLAPGLQPSDFAESDAASLLLSEATVD